MCVNILGALQQENLMCVTPQHKLNIGLPAHVHFFLKNMHNILINHIFDIF